MAAHTKNIEERNSNYQTIVSGLAFSGTFIFFFVLGERNRNVLIAVDDGGR
jgi:hypothetical protein